MADREIKFMFSEYIKFLTNITIDVDFTTLKIISLKDPDLIESLSKSFRNEKDLPILMDQLEFIGYIKKTGDKLMDYELRHKMKEIFKPAPSGVADWIEDWRSLFPKGSNRSGYRYRGDKQGCIKKMIKFVKNNPSIKRSEIFAATKKYIHKFRDDYTYMKLAHYFIEKDGNSTLLSEIEGLSEDQIEEFNFVNRL